MDEEQDDVVNEVETTTINVYISFAPNELNRITRRLANTALTALVIHGIFSVGRKTKRTYGIKKT